MSNVTRGERPTANLYEVLRLTKSATLVEIDRAYQQLMKESRYDTKINRKDVEAAYRVLHEPTSKAIYDASLAEYQKVAEQTAKTKKRADKKSTPRRMVKLVVVLSAIAFIFVFYRFGYKFKTFSEGDVLYLKGTHKKLGKVVQEQSNYDFGKAKADAYRIELDSGEKVWIPADDIKAITYEK